MSCISIRFALSLTTRLTVTLLLWTSLVHVGCALMGPGKLTDYLCWW